MFRLRIFVLAAQAQTMIAALQDGLQYFEGRAMPPDQVGNLEMHVAQVSLLLLCSRAFMTAAGACCIHKNTSQSCCDASEPKPLLWNWAHQNNKVFK